VQFQMSILSFLFVANVERVGSDAWSLEKKYSREVVQRSLRVLAFE